MIYLLTAVGLSPGGSSTVHIYTQTIHRTIQNKQYIEQHNNFGRVRAVPRLGYLYPGICLTTEGKVLWVHVNLINYIVTIYILYQHTKIYKVDMYSQYRYTSHCKRYGISEYTRNKIVLGRFIRGPDDNSKQS